MKIGQLSRAGLGLHTIKEHENDLGKVVRKFPTILAFSWTLFETAICFEDHCTQIDCTVKPLRLP